MSEVSLVLAPSGETNFKLKQVNRNACPVGAGLCSYRLVAFLDL